MIDALGSPACQWPLCFYNCSWCLFLALQSVLSYFALSYFMPAHNACSWLSSLFLATVLCHIHVLMMSVLGSSACAWLLCLAIFYACSWCLLLIFRSEWLLCLAIFHACSWCSLGSDLKWVLCHILCPPMMPLLDSPDCKWLLLYHIYVNSWCIFLVLQTVSSYCAFSYFMLMMPILDSPESGWLLYLAICYA